MRREDITGQLFGRLTAISYAGDRKWNCLCECGASTVVYTQQLKNGNSKSCGCFRKEHLSGLKTKDLVGMKFGRLSVISHCGTTAKNKAKWLCRCDCGKTSRVVGSGLMNGTTSSCGCLKAELTRERRFVDLTGRIFGKLSVIEFYGFSEVSRGSIWVCKCSCGKSKTVIGGSLVTGRTISCGCAMRDKKIHMPENALAYAAIANARRRSRKASASGSFTAAQIDRLKVLQKSKCASCRYRIGKNFHRDHIVALSIGGSNDIYNIQLLCQRCNQRKHAKTPEVWARENGRLI